MLQEVTTEIRAGACALQCISKWSGKKNKEEKWSLCWGVIKTKIDCEDLQEDGWVMGNKTAGEIIFRSAENLIHMEKNNPTYT